MEILSNFSLNADESQKYNKAQLASHLLQFRAAVTKSKSADYKSAEVSQLFPSQLSIVGRARVAQGSRTQAMRNFINYFENEFAN